MNTPQIIQREMRLSCSKMKSIGKRLRLAFTEVKKCDERECWGDLDLRVLRIEAENLARLVTRLEALVDLRDLMINEECIALAKAGGTDD